MSGAEGGRSQATNRCFCASGAPHSPWEMGPTPPGARGPGELVPRKMLSPE